MLTKPNLNKSSWLSDSLELLCKELSSEEVELYLDSARRLQDPEKELAEQKSTLAVKRMQGLKRIFEGTIEDRWGIISLLDDAIFWHKSKHREQSQGRLISASESVWKDAWAQPYHLYSSAARSAARAAGYSTYATAESIICAANARAQSSGMISREVALHKAYLIEAQNIKEVFDDYN